MTESTRPRPSSPIVRGKAVEVEMSRWVFKSCSFDDRAQRSWQGDPNIPAKDRRRQGLALNYMALSPGWSWSPQGKWSISSKQASTHGKRASSPSARGSREPWKCSGEEVEEDSAFLQEPSPLSSQVVLNDFRSMIYWYMWESWSHQRVCSGSSLFCQLPLPELGDGLQRHSWLDIREEYNVFNNVGRIRETHKL